MIDILINTNTLWLSFTNQTLILTSGNMIHMDSTCVGGNISPSEMSGSSSHASPQPAACHMDDHMSGDGAGII